MISRVDERAAAFSALERIVGKAELRDARIEPLAGGIRRRSWLVRFADGESAVLRMPERLSNALLDVTTESRAIAAAAAAGVAPAVMAADAETGVLLTRYRPGSSWTRDDARKPKNIQRLADVLRTLHAVPAELPVFEAERIARRYLAALPHDTREPHAAKWGDELKALARRYDFSYAPTAFCHNDLVAANVLDDGELALVDFEYAVRADALLDLANVAGMNGFDGEQQCALLAAYGQAEPARDKLAELEWLIRMVRLMAWFWAVLGLAADDTHVYASYVAELGARLREDERRWRT
jgi:thiamine kinase-like enzyme